jgi:quercetin dioxygenase-like cupin family protein
MNPETRLDVPGPLAAPRPAPDPLADEASGLLQGALAEAWPSSPATGLALRERLARRAADSARAIAAMVNVRQRERVLLEQSSERRVHQLYRRAAAEAMRPGEPVQVRLVELAPNAAWMLPAGEPDVGRDWLLMQGSALVQAEGEAAVELRPLDYLVQGDAASRAAACASAGAQGAVLMLRERALGGAGQGTRMSREAPGQWEEYAPLIKRRLLWQEGPLAAMLWLAEPGASVPHHRHGHDEECLMLRGDLFQDDCLLREGDYQLAPSGSAHLTVSTDTGALIYAHGDLDMQLTGE